MKSAKNKAIEGAKKGAKTEQYKCQSYADNKGKIKNCTCGKCR